MEPLAIVVPTERLSANEELRNGALTRDVGGCGLKSGAVGFLIELDDEHFRGFWVPGEGGL